MGEHCSRCGFDVDGAHLDTNGDPICNSCGAAWMEGERDAAREQLREAVGALREAREHIAAYSPRDDAGYYDDSVQAILDRLDTVTGDR